MFADVSSAGTRRAWWKGDAIVDGGEEGGMSLQRRTLGV